jgi:glycosyltransferase involved in cell wall biosynthesis
MKISIVTATNNSQDTIARNINSVLNQTHQDSEQVIVDNLSTDKTLDIAAELYKGMGNRLIVHSGRDQGISDAFNKGIKNSSGEIVLILNSDDYLPDKDIFEKVVYVFNNNPTLLFVHGNLYFEDPVFGSNIRKPLQCDITEAMPYNHPTMFIRRSVYTNSGYYDTEYKYAMDYEYVIRLQKIKGNLKKKSYYMQGSPLAVMNAGGASWKNEIEAIKEGKRALQTHGFWDVNAFRYYTFRILRTSMKKYLNSANMNKVVTFWRKRKWSVDQKN